MGKQSCTFSPCHFLTSIKKKAKGYLCRDMNSLLKQSILGKPIKKEREGISSLYLYDIIIQVVDGKDMIFEKILFFS